MYQINRQNNRVQPLKRHTFAELGFKERQHLQEWIANQPDILGEDLLIIQKEFAKFSDTNERLDLLALDKEGSLVIIENKLDDTGRDVTWQALKYASYCSRMSKEEIREIFQSYLDQHDNGSRAEDKLSAFFNDEDFADLSLNKGMTQRIILIGAKFRKEVTSTVLWLANFDLRIKCFKVTPFAQDDNLFLSIEQIIPTKDAEDFVISLAGKARDEIKEVEADKTRHKIRKEFWTELLSAAPQRTSLYNNTSPSRENWITGGSGLGRVTFNLAITGHVCRAEVYIDRGNLEENERIFRTLEAQREEIENLFGGSLNWENNSTKRSRKITAESAGNVFEKEAWPGMIEFLIDAVVRLERAFKGPLARIKIES